MAGQAQFERRSYGLTPHNRLGLALRVRTVTGVLAWLENCRAAVYPGTQAFECAALAA